MAKKGISQKSPNNTKKNLRVGGKQKKGRLGNRNTYTYFLPNIVCTFIMVIGNTCLYCVRTTKTKINLHSLFSNQNILTRKWLLYLF